MKLDTASNLTRLLLKVTMLLKSLLGAFKDGRSNFIRISTL
jgi:hypothetical protein